MSEVEPEQEGLEQKVMRLEWELLRMKVRTESLSKMLVSLIDDVVLDSHGLFGSSLTYREIELLRQIRGILAKTTTEEIPQWLIAH